jgi:hypothetical protein
MLKKVTKIQLIDENPNIKDVWLRLNLPDNNVQKPKKIPIKSKVSCKKR